MTCPMMVWGQEINVRVFSRIDMDRISLVSMNGHCQIHTKEGFLTVLNEGNELMLRLNSSKKIHISQDGRFLGISDSLYIYQLNRLDYLKFVSPRNQFKSRKYQGDFKIFENKGSILILNDVLLDDYLEGVLASEAGVNLETEYYKVQAIISRTYALNNSNKHSHEGFNLCDDVHCQAYLGHYEGESNGILNGVRSTQGIILLDSNDHKFPVFFSANCGGQSSETDQIWNTSIPLYTSRKDTFCIDTRQAIWEKYIPKTEVYSFLNETYFLDIENENIADKIINFQQENRKTFFIHPSFGIPLRDIRAKFGLKSTYFSTEQVGDKILFKGKGFGHGVGLCQEGAMNMIKRGYKHYEVLKYYFTGAKISNYRQHLIYK
jgi:stage II sporulation protein D